MTVIRFDPQTDADDGTIKPLAGVLTAYATAARANGESVVFPGMAEWRFTESERPTVALDPPGINWAYVLRFQPQYGDALERAVQFSGDTVDWDALSDVDPSTFEPIIPTPPSAADLLAQAIQVLTQVQGYASLSVGGVLQGNLPNPGLNDSAVDLFVGAKIAAAGTHTQQAVATAVTAGITAWVGAAPQLLDTLAEIDAQLATDEGAVAALTTLLAQKAPLASPALSGVPTAPTATPGTNTTQIATAAFVKAALDSLATSFAATTASLVEFPSSLPAGTALAHRYDPIQQAYNITADTTRKWDAAKARMKNGGAPARILTLGHSVVVGTSDSTPRWKYSFATKLRDLMSAKYGPAGTGLVYLVTTALSDDSRVVFNGTWSQALGTRGAFNAGCYNATGTANTMTFTPDVPVDSFTVYYIKNTASGTFSASVDGGAPTTANAFGSGTESFGKLVIPAGSLGAHTLTITPPASQAVYIVAVEGTVGSSGVRVSRCGRAGAATATIATSGTVGVDSLSTIFSAQASPDLTVVMCEINDYNTAVPVSTFVANLTTIVQRAQATGDVLVIVDETILTQPNSGGVYQSAYHAAIYGLADSLGFGVLDIASRWKDYATSVAPVPGFYANSTADPSGIHPSAVGHQDIANATFAILATGTAEGLTKAAVGLDQVDNTSDAAKPIPTAQAAVNAQVAGAVGYTGTFRNAWAGNIAYVVGDVVTAEAGLFTCTTAHTANGAGFRYDREKWAAVPIPVLAGATTVPVRQQNVTSPGAGIATPLTAGVFQQRAKQFSRRTEKTIAVHQAASDLTITRANGTVTLGTAVGGSLILTSPTTATEGQYMGAAFAAAQDLRNGSVKLPINLSAYAGNYFTVDFTSAVGGTDFTNYTRFNLVSGNIDSPRTGQWYWVGANTGDTPDGQGTALADLSAVTGYRYTTYRSTANFTCEIGPRLIFQPTQATIAKCILWLDDGGFASHQTAIKTAAKYGLPVTIAPTAANLVNGSGGISLDMARYMQDFLGGQVAVHAFGEVDHNRAQSGMTLLEQLLDYQHFGMAAGLSGVEDMAYWSSGFTGPNSNEMELSVKKLARSARGGIARQTEALPPIDPWKTRAMMTGGTDTSVGTWQPYAQRAINAKGLVQFVWHDMTGSIPTEFATFCAWLAANSASIQVTTPQGAFDPLCV